MNFFCTCLDVRSLLEYLFISLEHVFAIKPQAFNLSGSDSMFFSSGCDGVCFSKALDLYFKWQ